MGTSLADPGVSVTGTYTGGGRGVLSILRSLRRGDRQLTRAAGGPARARVMTRSPAALLDAWTRTLHAHGYSSGVYSSASSGAENLGWAHRVTGHAIAKPDSMWFGLWDNEQNVRGLPYLLRSWWQGPRRIKQYEGPHRRSLGGYPLDIDSDWVYGAVYR